jgi:hypothetical protein
LPLLGIGGRRHHQWTSRFQIGEQIRDHRPLYSEQLGGLVSLQIAVADDLGNGRKMEVDQLLPEFRFLVFNERPAGIAEILGDLLLQAACAASRDACLIAPFIKADVVDRLFAELSKEVRVTIVTRWIPAEIAAGVSDLEVFDAVACRSGATLYLNAMLHAKLYRFDEDYIFGSANLTSKALGWRAPANIEILKPAVGEIADLRRFEADLLASSMRADARYRDEVQRQVDGLIETGFDAAALAAETGGMPSSWLPTCAVPEKLWEVYSDQANAGRRMVESAFEAAKADIASLQIGKGLSEVQFYRAVSGTLNQMPLVRAIEREAAGGLDAERAAALIVAGGSPTPYGTEQMWEILVAWLQYYFPDRYRIEPKGEVLRYGRILG